MAVDTGQPGLAQRYYIQALRLAQAAGDRGYGGYVLAASMSHLAAQLGNPREIAQLARAAQEGAKGRATPRAEALFHAAEARGHALLGDGSAADAAMGRAADSMEQAGTESADDPVWISHFDHAYLADELAHCHRDLGRPAQAARYAEQALVPPGHPGQAARHRPHPARRRPGPGAGHRTRLPHRHPRRRTPRHAPLQPRHRVPRRPPATADALPGRAGGAGVRGPPRTAGGLRWNGPSGPARERPVAAAWPSTAPWVRVLLHPAARPPGGAGPP
ncbi:hypothetical protein ACFQVA_24680 [Actinomadura keratinilytica]